MNNKTIIAWIDDFEASARIAKLVTENSYDLKLVNELELIKKINEEILIVDLNCIDDNDLWNLSNIKGNNFFVLLGFCKELTADLINYYSSLGCDIVLQRKEFLNNLHSIIRKAFHAY